MRIYWIRTLLVLAFCALSAKAQIIVYRGVMVQKHAGNGMEARHEYRSYLILNTAIGACRRIDYFPGSGNFYMVLPEQQVLTNLVALKDGRTQTVLASAQQGSAASPVMALFAKGINSRLQIGTNSFVSTARVLDWSLRSAGPGESGASELIEETGIFTFVQTLTYPITNRRENMDQAEQRIRAALQTAGYREIELK